MRVQKTSVISGGHLFQAVKQIPLDLPLNPDVVSQPVSATKRGRATDLAGSSATLIDPMLRTLWCFPVP